MTTTISRSIGLATLAAIAACGGDQTPPPAAPDGLIAMSDSGAFAMPSPARSEALLNEGGGATIVDTSHHGTPDALAARSADRGTQADAMVSAEPPGSVDSGRGADRADQAKPTASKAPPDGGAPKKK